MRVEVAPAEAEVAADLLWQAGATAIEERDGELLAGFPTADQAAEALASVGSRWRASPAVEGGTDEWLDAWRPWARAVRAGRRIVVQPAWVPPIAEPGDVVVLLDPGHAFGSGSHPSTRLALAALERLVERGASVLDAGCGSGVLSIAAALLGASRVVAFDVSGDALVATRENAAINGVGEIVTSSAAALADVDGSFDVVVANIGATVLTGMAVDLAARVGPGGALVLSGLLDDQWQAVAAAYDGLAVDEVLDEEGWSTPVLVRRSSR